MFSQLFVSIVEHCYTCVAALRTSRTEIAKAMSTGDDAIYAPSSPGGASDAGWDGLVSEEVASQEDMHQKILEADEALSGSEACGDIDGGEDDMASKSTACLYTAQEKVQRYEKSRAADPYQDGLPLPADDPFWINAFTDITDKLELPKEINNFKRNFTVLSGCTGLCAEGWALKARLLWVRVSVPC